MWGSITGLFKSFFQALNVFAQWRREAALREDGAAREVIKQYQESARVQSIADEIDRMPDITDPSDLLQRMRKQREAAANQLGETDLLAPGNSGLAQWSAG